VKTNGAGVTTTLGASTTINSLNFNSFATGNTIAADGSTLTINGTADSNTDVGGNFSGNAAGNGIDVFAGAGTVTINVPIILGGTNNQTWTNNSGSLLTVNGNVTGGSTSSGQVQTLTLTNTGAGGTTIAGVISDLSGGGKVAVTVSNSGSGITTLSGSNTFTGGLALTSGNLALGNNGALASGTVTVSAGQLDLAGYNPVITNLQGSAGTITDSGAAATMTLDAGSYGGAINDGAGQVSVVKLTSGILALTGSNGYSGTTTLSGGTLQINSPYSLGNGGNLIFNGGTLQLTAPVTTSRNYVINSGANAVIDTNGNTLTDNGAISNASGTGGLTKLNTGTLVLGGSNSYAGATTVSAGTLQLANAYALPSASAVDTVASTNLTISPGAFLDLNGYSVAVSGGVPSGTGTITNINGGTTSTLTLTGAYGGVLTDGVGSSTGAGALAVTYSDGGASVTIQPSTSITNTYTGGTTIANGVRFAPTVASAGSGLITVQSGGQYYTYQNVGTVTNNFNLAGNGAPSDTPALGALRLTATETGMITLAGATTIGSEGLVPGYFQGQITGAADLYMLSGILVLDNTTSNPTNYTGNTYIDAYVGSPTSGGAKATTVRLGASNQIPSTSSVTINTNNPATTAGFDMNGHNDAINGLNGTGIVDDVSAGGTSLLTIGSSGGSGSFSGVIKNTTGVVSVTKTGTGTETFSGADTYTGANLINGGILNASSSSALGTGHVTFGGGTLQYGTSGAAGTDLSSRIVSSGSAISLDTDGQTVTYASALAGSNTGGLTLQDSAGSPGSLTLAAADAYFGATTVNSGALNLTGTLTSSSSVAVNGGSFTVNSGGTVAAASTVSVANGATFTVQSGGSLGSAPALTDNGTVNFNNAAQTVSSLNGTSTGSLALGASTTLSVSSGGTYAGGISGSGNLNLTGGTLTIASSSGAANSTGNVNVNGGTLIVSGYLSGGLTTVNSAAILGGTGFLESPVQVNQGGTISAGVGQSFAGTSLTIINNVTLSGTATVALNVDGSGNLVGGLGVADYLYSFGSLTLDPSNTDILSLTVLGGVPSSSQSITYVIAYDGTESGQFGSVVLNGEPASFQSINYDYQGDNEIAVTLTVVPEPGSWAMVLGGMGMLAVYQQRRRASRRGQS
jgi:autotransporter-associated beta strand protein